MTVSSGGGNSGGAQLNLPFTPVNSNDTYIPFLILNDNGAGGSDPQLVLQITSGNIQALIYNTQNGNIEGVLTSAHILANAILFLQFNYQIAPQNSIVELPVIPEPKLEPVKPASILRKFLAKVF